MTDQIAVLIGTGSIGVAIARQCAVGRTLVLADRDQEQLDVRAEELRNEGFTVETHPVDVSNREQVEELATFADGLGTVTRIVHAAGVSPNQAPPQTIVAVDLLGTAFVLDAFGKVIGQGGAGIVIASQAGHMGSFDAEVEAQLAHAPLEDLATIPALTEVADSGAAYILAKRANALRVQAAALSWGDRGARVNCLSPGIISTPLGRHEMNGPQAEAYRVMLDRSPAGRMGTPSEIAGLAAFLLDERGSFITGSDILCDGGVIAAMRAGQIG